MRPTVTSPLERSGDGLLITGTAILGAPLLGAALLTALYTRMATALLPSSRVAAPVTLWRPQSPCALYRGDRACFVGKEPPRGWRPRRAFRLDPWQKQRQHRRCPLEERSLVREKPSRGSPGLESLVLSEIF